MGHYSRSRTRRLALLLAASALPGAGCDAGIPSSHTEAPVVAEDSAGVRIVTHREGFEAGLAGWELAREPAVVIGAVDGEEPDLFTSMPAATRLSDGRIAVVEGRTRQIRLFDAEGHFVEAMGGEGDGPGEFRGILDVLRTPGDTFVVWDEQGGRITWLSPDGDVLDTAPRPPPSTSHYGTLLGDGSRVVPQFDGAVRADRPGLWRPTTRLVRSDQATGDIDSIGVWRGGEMVSGPEGRPWSAPAPRQTVLASAGTARRFAVADTESFDVALHAVDTGAAEVRIRRAAAPTPVSADRLEAWREEVAAEAEAMAEAFAGMAMDPEGAIATVNARGLTVPALADVVLGPDGQVWVEEYRTEEGAPRRFTVFDARGEPVARLTMPRGLDEARVLEVGRDELLLAVRDSLDVLTLEVRPILR